MESIVDSQSNYFFEGTEKLLEIWFEKYDDNNEDSDLRVIPSRSLSHVII